MKSRFEFNMENAPKLEGRLAGLYHPSYNQVVGWYGDDRGNGTLFIENEGAKLFAEVPLRNGMLQGTIRGLSADGSTLMYTAEYSENYKLGWERSYYHDEEESSINDGATIRECKWEGLCKTGTEKSFNKEGALLSETEWAGGDWVCLSFKRFKPDGTPIEEINTGDKCFHGPVRLYNDDGSIHYEGYFINDYRCEKEEFENYERNHNRNEID